jgi:hypothetical protein
VIAASIVKCNTRTNVNPGVQQLYAYTEDRMSFAHSRTIQSGWISLESTQTSSQSSSPSTSLQRGKSVGSGIAAVALCVRDPAVEDRREVSSTNDDMLADTGAIGGSDDVEGIIAVSMTVICAADSIQVELVTALGRVTTEDAIVVGSSCWTDEDNAVTSILLLGDTVLGCESVIVTLADIQSVSVSVATPSSPL